MAIPTHAGAPWSAKVADLSTVTVCSKFNIRFQIKFSRKSITALVQRRKDCFSSSNILIFEPIPELLIKLIKLFCFHSVLNLVLTQHHLLSAELRTMLFSGRIHTVSLVRVQIEVAMVAVTITQIIVRVTSLVRERSGQGLEKSALCGNKFTYSFFLSERGF